MRFASGPMYSNHPVSTQSSLRWILQHRADRPESLLQQSIPQRGDLLYRSFLHQCYRCTGVTDRRDLDDRSVLWSIPKGHLSQG